MALLGVSLSRAAAAETRASAGLPEWRNAQGARFHASPVEALGPFALFGPEAPSNRLLKFRALSEEQCVNFHRAVTSRPPRAAHWADAQGTLTRELLGRVQAVTEANGTAPAVGSLPEPELLLIYFHTSNAPPEEAAVQDSILDSVEPFARRVRRIYPGRVEVIVAVARPGAKGPPPASPVWMTADPKQLTEIGVLRGFIPVVTSGLLLITREGVPIAGGAVRDLFTLARMIDHASTLLWDLNPENPRTLSDRAHYRRAVRPVQFASGAAPPEILASPLPLEMLRRNGLARIDARIEIDAEGNATGVTLRSPTEWPTFLAEALRETIRRSDVFVPAIYDGQPVAGALDHAFAVPPTFDPRLAAETAWVQGEARVRVPIASWLVLRPIRVAEHVLTSIDRVRADGTVVLSSVSAGTAQLDSFRDDWFNRTGGAGSVQPAEGREQEIGGEKLVWQRLKPVQDFVDLARGTSGSDHCVGYAWTEVESPAETDAWLGIGSNDGLKVWVNGRLVADSWSVRPSRLDDDVIPFRLKAGRNQILVKIQNETGPWSFIARLRVQDR